MPSTPLLDIAGRRRSPATRSKRYSPRRTATPGPAAVITPCCYSRSSPDSEPPSSRACAYRTSNSRAVPGSGAEAKEGKRGAPRSAGPPATHSSNGYSSAAGNRPVRSSPTAADSTSPAVLSGGSSSNTPPPHANTALPGEQEHHAAHVASHGCDAHAARAHPDRHRDDRAVARARRPRHHQKVRPRRHGTQTTRARPHRAPEHQARTLPPTRPPARVPREPLTLRTMSCQRPPPP